MRRARNHALRINLNNSRASNEILVRKLLVRPAKHNVSGARETGRDLVDLVVLVSTGDADLDGDLHEAVEEDGVDLGGGGNLGVEFHGRFEGVVEGHGGFVGLGVVLGALEREGGEGHEGEGDGAAAAANEG